MQKRKSAYSFRWIVLLFGLAVIVALLGANFRDSSAQISLIPTPTRTPFIPTDTPLPPTPTDTPLPPTPTDTPLPPTPTDTPVPPTPTDTPVPPIPDAPQLGAIAIDPPEALVATNDSLVATVPLTMPNLLDLATVTWHWGDGTTSTCPLDLASCAVQSGNSTPAEISGHHAYAQTGVYAVQVVVMDRFDQFDTAIYEFVVVYDPAAGFVSGGGWIDSAPGAYLPDTGIGDRATLGFVLKYKKGASSPEGSVGFQLDAADLSFDGTDYHWLVFADSYASIRGSGTINGQGDYQFMLWAGDQKPDTFRLKIWWQDSQNVEHVVYDNGLDQPIGGGAIVIHTN